MSSYAARFKEAFAFSHLPPLEANVLAIQCKVDALLVLPKAATLVFSYFYLSTYCTTLFLFLNVGGWITIGLVPWCNTVRRADLLSWAIAFIYLHCAGGIFMTQGPILWGIIPGPFALVMPTIARLSSQPLSWRKNPQLILVVYVWVFVNTLFMVRYFGYFVSSATNHGIIDGVRIVLNLSIFNGSIVAAGWFLRCIVDTGTIQAQNRLFASISHDMRQPCHAMSLLIPLITEAIFAAETEGTTVADVRHLLDRPKQDMSILKGLVETLLALVEDFLLFSKLRESPDLVPPADDVAFTISTLLEEVGFVGAPLASEKHLKFNTECEGLDKMVLVGPAKDLKRIIGNFMANAINCTSSGCVTLHAKQMQSDATTTPANAVRVQFSVKDTGAGISKSAQSKLWLPFVRGGNENATAGTGLGLFISKKLVEGMGGELSLKSAPGEGSTFSFILALALSSKESASVSKRASPERPLPTFELHPSSLDPGETPTSSTMPSASSSRRGRSPSPQRPLLIAAAATKRDICQIPDGAAARILIVDDAPINCKLLARTFNKAAKNLGIASPTIVTAKNGQEAVDLVVASLPSADVIDVERGVGLPFNLICLDRQMPVMDGVEATRQIKAVEDGHYKDVVPSQVSKQAYIVGMSASIESPTDWLAVGLDEMLLKPCIAKDIEELLLAMTTNTPAAPMEATILPGAPRISEEGRALPESGM